MKITYGIINNTIDVTELCLTSLNNNNIITIPFDDNHRARIFTDPVPNVLKSIFITNNDNVTSKYDHTLNIFINIVTNNISAIDVNAKVLNIQSKLLIKHGIFCDEFPEQRMVCAHLTGNEKVLEIGANIGRNSLIIGYILKEQYNKNFVTLESDPTTVTKLIENRDLNNMKFHIEASALSKRKLIQQGWSTIESDTLLDGYTSVNSITLDELKLKYNIIFDTLVLDCEGAFYNILQDMPEILDNINLIIMENDYWDITHKNYIDQVLRAANFNAVYKEPGGWGPCFNNFYEVWKR